MNYIPTLKTLHPCFVKMKLPDSCPVQDLQLMRFTFPVYVHVPTTLVNKRHLARFPLIDSVTN